MSRNALAATGGNPSPVLKPLSRELCRSIRVAREVCLVGSHARVHLPLHSPMISRTHALIVIDGPETYIRDLASRNGVYLNGHVAREARLRHGDLVCIGPYAFWWSALPLPSPRPRHLALSTPPPAQICVQGESSPRIMLGHTYLIGSREDCDLMTDTNMVDPAHAIIYRKGGSFFLRDLNSRTGTHVNNRRSRKHELRSGDEIRIGLKRFRFEPPAQAQIDQASELAIFEQTSVLTGLDGAPHADHQFSESGAAGKACPTIEQLLGAATERITCWEHSPRHAPEC